MVGSMASSKHSKMEMKSMAVQVDEMKGEGASNYLNGEEECCEYTLDGSVDLKGRPAIKGKTGGWVTGTLLLVNQGLATLAFSGVEVNLTLFLTRVLRQNNADAANDVSKWIGTTYIFSLIGAFLSDSYWGRYKTCAIFQVIFVVGLMLLSLSSYLFLLKPSGCGDEDTFCGSHSSLEIGGFYLSIYLIALGDGGCQPNIATLGADQFDEEDQVEAHSKVSFFSFFYLALNLGSLFSDTFLVYYEDKGMWALGFWASTGSAFVALALFLGGTPRYRHFKPGGNPITRVCQVIAAVARKWRVRMSPGDSNSNLYEVDSKVLATTNRGRKMLHTQGFKFLDRAAFVDSDNMVMLQDQSIPRDPWLFCTVTQVEEVKCILRLIPIWLTTIIYSVVFTQMASLFVEQGDAMDTIIAGFEIPPASMSIFNILSVVVFIFFYHRLLTPLVSKLRKDPKGLTELQRMGIGLIIAIMAMIAAGIVEVSRLKHACNGCKDESSLSILWQVPQYMLIGASEVFMYVGQLEFFNDQVPDGLKSFGSALCMTSISLGNYMSSLLVTIVMKITMEDNRPGWISGNPNKGHMDRFYFLLAALTSADFLVYVACARWYKCIKLEERSGDDDEDNSV